jgi:hypothetical protein
VLFQFPPWFYPGNEQREFILSCKQKLPQYRLAIEFRHNSWLNEKNTERTLTFLRDNDLPLVCVDEPQGFKSSVPPVTEITSDIGLVRFHGHNQETWEKKGIGPPNSRNRPKRCTCFSITATRTKPPLMPSRSHLCCGLRTLHRQLRSKAGCSGESPMTFTRQIP